MLTRQVHLRFLALLLHVLLVVFVSNHCLTCFTLKFHLVEHVHDISVDVLSGPVILPALRTMAIPSQPLCDTFGAAELLAGHTLRGVLDDFQADSADEVLIHRLNLTLI